MVVVASDYLFAGFLAQKESAARLVDLSDPCVVPQRVFAVGYSVLAEVLPAVAVAVAVAVA